ncbi:hypothetical protein C4546_00075 [Candidatus Parcubacteria bacterium]|nr:MAG: hypothetical protein C4546_00075 [Candidatus Parcubacteria bacterium]
MKISLPDECISISKDRFLIRIGLFKKFLQIENKRIMSICLSEGPSESRLKAGLSTGLNNLEQPYFLFW